MEEQRGEFCQDTALGKVHPLSRDIMQLTDQGVNKLFL